MSPDQIKRAREKIADYRAKADAKRGRPLTTFEQLQNLGRAIFDDEAYFTKIFTTPCTPSSP